nr:MAG TPA: hypothetical protein [Bacteriophage sp.]
MSGGRIPLPWQRRPPRGRGPSVSFSCLRERTAELSAYQGRCASSITAGSSSRKSGRTGKKRMADSAEPAGGFSAFRPAVSI